MAEMDQITQRLSCLDQWPILQIHMLNPNPSTHGLGLGLTGALPQGHNKVTERSNSLKKVKVAYFAGIASIQLTYITKLMAPTDSS